MKILQSTPLGQTTPQPAPVNPQKTAVDTTTPTPDLEKEVLEEPLDEAAGLSDDAESLAAIGFEAMQKRFQMNAERIIQSIASTGKAQMKFSDERLQNTVAGMVVFHVTFELDPGVQMLRLRQASLPPMDPNHPVYINVQIGYGEVFAQAPRVYQLKSLTRLANSEELKSALVHETTHVIETLGRTKNGGQFESNVLHLSDALAANEVPEVAALGFMMYLIEDGEMNARVAEVGTLMKNASVDAPREELIQSIQQSRVWREMKRLLNFKADHAYNFIIKGAQSLLPQGGIDQAENVVAGAISKTLEQYAFNESQGGHSRTSQRLRRCFIGRVNGESQDYQKDLMGTLRNLEALFNERGLDLKRRVLKTISLARQEQPVPKPELAEQDGQVIDEMAYPVSFDRGAFHELKNYTQRINYCKQNLTYLAQGTSRIVFAIDDERVLKLAKNAKGIAQNEGECMYDFQNYYGDYVAKVFDSHPQDLWIEMEKAVKISPTKFRQITGVDFKDMDVYLSNKFAKNYHNTQDPRISAFMDDNEFMQELSEMVGQYELLPGDIGKLNSWGLVKRGGREMAVLIDFGLGKSNYEDHYEKPQQARAQANADRYRHQAYNE